MKLKCFRLSYRLTPVAVALTMASLLPACSRQNADVHASTTVEKSPQSAPWPKQSPEDYSETRSVLDRARSLRCEFPSGAFVDLADPKLRRQDSHGAEVTFDAIDRKGGHARIIAKSGAADVTVISGPTALTFVEVSPTGNPLVTVVFPRFLAGTRKFFAADSEHIFMFGAVHAR